jgi:hypothetical protein
MDTIVTPSKYTSEDEWKSPLHVYVLWGTGSSKTELCEKLAERIYAELCRDPDDPLHRGIGIPTYFRSVLAHRDAPFRIDLKGAERVCAVALVHSDMLLDDTWRAYLGELANSIEASKEPHLFLPVAVSKGAESSSLFKGKNSIRYYELGDNAELRTLTSIVHELCRQLSGDVKPGNAPAPVRLFLSHAKKDGKATAETLKKRIEDATAAKPFFDAVDIAPGYKFPNEILESIKQSAMVAIATDVYSSRPWCRQEILLAKKHERPVILVNALEKEDLRLFPYLGNVPAVRWAADVDMIIYAALREALRFEHTRQRLEKLRRAGRFPKDAKIMARPPELIDLQSFLATDDQRPLYNVVYPDPPLGREELETLGGFCMTTKFLTASMPFGNKGLEGRTIGVSVSDHDDLATLGLGETHLRDATMEVARSILAHGAGLAYGGDLRPNGLTWNLLNLVFAYAGGSEKDRLRNYRAWVVHKFEDEKTRDALTEIIDRSTFINLDLPADVLSDYPEEVKQKPSKDAAVGRYIAGRSLTLMREKMRDETNARIVLGGRVSGYSGSYPGILEEVYLAMTKHTSVYILGGYGGCAGCIAELVKGGSPAELTLDYQIKTNPNYDRFVALHNSKSQQKIDYEKVTSLIRDNGIEGLNNGLEKDENLRLLESVNLDEVTYLVLKGLTNLN